MFENEVEEWSNRIRSCENGKKLRTYTCKLFKHSFSPENISHVIRQKVEDNFPKPVFDIFNKVGQGRRIFIANIICILLR